MRKTRLTGTHNDKDKSGREHNSSFHSFVSLSVCALTVIAVTGGCKLAGTEKHKVYAASENESSSLYSEDVDYDLPSGIAGVVSGVNATPAAGSTVNRIGISCDDVIVGQRVRKVTSSAVEMNVSESMATTVDTFDAKVVSASSSAKLMSDEDYENLLQIVEAEAGTEDLKGSIPGCKCYHESCEISGISGQCNRCYLAVHRWCGTVFSDRGWKNFGSSSVG